MALTDKLTAIADAIRAKTGKTDSMTLDTMPTEIAGISTGFPNGLKWTKSNVGVASKHVCYAEGLWLAATEDGLYYSTDGKIWTKSNVESGGSYSSVHHANGQFVAVATGGIYYSTDGKVWTLSNVTGTHYGYTILNHNGIWVAGRSSCVYYSVDGKEWTLSNLTSTGLYSLSCGNGMWVLASGGPGVTGGLRYSTDGITWTDIADVTDEFNGVLYGNGVWVAAGKKSIYRSKDGVTWNLVSSLSDGNRKELHYANGIWHIMDGDDAAKKYGLYYSTDGITWIQCSNSTSYGYRVGYANGVWLKTANGDDGYSFDGINWYRAYGISAYPDKAVYKNGIWVAPGSMGLFYSIGWEPT